MPKLKETYEKLSHRYSSEDFFFLGAAMAAATYREALKNEDPREADKMISDLKKELEDYFNE